MITVSYIIPVYNAETTLRKCVESIVFGQAQNVEILLIDDCSTDGSLTLCRTLEQEFSQVRCLRNETNRGVSYTRNHGLREATGRYVLFVDSDDWVSGDYGKVLIDTFAANPDKLVLCGYTFFDKTNYSRRTYGIIDGGDTQRVLSRREFFLLLDDILLMQLWNKAFDLQIIRDFDIRFDESISMGEDFQFVLEYLQAANPQSCLILNKPLYYYVRHNNTSLMSRFGRDDPHTALGRLDQLRDFCGREDPAVLSHWETAVDGMKRNYIYRIIRSADLSRQQKELLVRNLGGRITHHDRLIKCYEKALAAKVILLKFCKRAWNRLKTFRSNHVIRSTRKKLKTHDFTIIAQNCIGGVFYHDMGLPFQTPTVNLFLYAPDFVKFASNLPHYLNCPLQLRWGNDYPVATLDDLTVHFMHYESCTEAKAIWERRKSRIRFDRLLVISTDRHGFDDEVFAMWKAIPYPKVLFSSNPKHREDPNTVFFKKYAADGCVPNLIPKREFYKDNALLNTINKLVKEKI